MASSTLAQVLPSAATVVATILGALITGFGAAALKHKWDSEADDKRWRRESAARSRVERLGAFAQYLAARPSLEAVRSLPSESKDATVIVSSVRLAAAHLLILLPDAGQRNVVESDLRTVEGWVTSWLTSRAARTDVPSDRAILDLARDLAAEPDQKAATRPQRRHRWRIAGRWMSTRRDRLSWRRAGEVGPAQPDDAAS